MTPSSSVCTAHIRNPCLKFSVFSPIVSHVWLNLFFFFPEFTSQQKGILLKRKITGVSNKGFVNIKSLYGLAGMEVVFECFGTFWNHDKCSHVTVCMFEWDTDCVELLFIYIQTVWCRDVNLAYVSVSY